MDSAARVGGFALREKDKKKSDQGIIHTKVRMKNERHEEFNIQPRAHKLFFPNVYHELVSPLKGMHARVWETSLPTNGFGVLVVTTKRSIFSTPAFNITFVPRAKIPPHPSSHIQ